MLPAQPNQSLIDGLNCLQTLATSPSPMGGRELARLLKMEPTRVNRLLKTLAHLGMTQQAPDRKYLAGPAMHVLSAQSLFASGLIRRSLKHLETLRIHRLTVAMGVLWKDQVCYLFHGDPSLPFTDGLGRMGLYPASRSSIGLMLLAWNDPRQVGKLFRGRRIDGFPRGIDSLLKKLDRIRRDGYAHVINSPSSNGSLAVPVGTPPHAAIALAGTITRQQKPRLVEALQVTAQHIDRPDNRT
jgi:DNA-binding IclR family transcriptional regulator